MTSPDEPQPIPLAEAKRIWNLQQQNAPLSKEDGKLLEQAAIWQMWKSHGIRLNDGNTSSNASSKLSENSPEKTAAS